MSARPIADAEAAVERMVLEHPAVAIPFLIAACISWSVAHGGSDAIRGTLTRAIGLVDELEAEQRMRVQ